MISHEDIKKLSHADCVKLAVKAASLVSHLSDDPRVLDAIEAVEDWLADPSEKNTEAVRDAVYAAWAAAEAADSAAAWDAADAAEAAAEAARTTWATWAAAAARAAVSAARAAIKADPSVEVVLVKYLEELLVRGDVGD